MFSTLTAFLMSRYGLMKDRFRSAGDFFKVLDVNGDGVLQHEEFQRSMKKVFKGEQQGFLGDYSDVHWVSTKKALESSWIFCGIQIISISKKSEVLVYHEISWNVIQWHGMSFNIMKRREMSWNHETFRFALLQPWFPLSFSMDLKWCYKSTSRCQPSESPRIYKSMSTKVVETSPSSAGFLMASAKYNLFRSFSKVSNDVHLDCSYLFALAGFLLVTSLRCESCLRIPWIDFSRIKTSTHNVWWTFADRSFLLQPSCGMLPSLKGTFSPEDVRKLFNAADTSGRGNVTLQDKDKGKETEKHAGVHFVHWNRLKHTLRIVQTDWNISN